ncbi:uncharacterized protein [Polyergus mexicanus]|uniref:uncharacterized protein n=1 Tax=Polyergus mexicanus TaxID=615972 RepID=UPI0038B5DDDF
MYKKLNCTDGVLSRTYGVPKIHKTGHPLRVIVSSTNTPLYELAAFLHNTINSSIPTTSSHINNSFQLVEKLKNKYIHENIELISLDVVLLFTNVPIDLAMDSINNRCNHINDNCNIPRDEFLNAIRFVLDLTFFTFSDVIYRQTFGIPMGSPLSPIIADITLQSGDEGDRDSTYFITILL